MGKRKAPAYLFVPRDGLVEVALAMVHHGEACMRWCALRIQLHRLDEGLSCSLK